MTPSSMWDRLRHARLVQVLVLYVGASWVVLQIADVLVDTLSLPGWVGPVAVLLLLIGLVIVLATAWIQGDPRTTAREDSGEVPGTWDLAPTDIGRSLRAGRLPHLTWPRAIVGGIVALSLLFGVAGAYVLFNGRPPMLATPLEADEAPRGVAVVPFSVSGAGAELWREGMVDLFATNLDGLGGLRAIDSRTLLARWREHVPEREDTDLRTALQVAGTTGARYALVGSAVALGDAVRLTADLYDVTDGEKLGGGRVEGPSADVLRLVDRLTVETVAVLLAESSPSLAAGHRLENLTTSSLPALRAYLEGEAAYRQADFGRAAEAYERAVAEDSTFALAYRRLDSTYGWLERPAREREVQAAAALARWADRLPARERALWDAWRIWGEDDPVEAERLLRSAVERYPDDPDAWESLAEVHIHSSAKVLASPDETLRLLQRPVDLDPGFAPYYIHLVQAHTQGGDSATARSLLDRYLELSPDNHQGHALSLGWDLHFGDEQARAAAAHEVAGLTGHVFNDLLSGLGGGPAGFRAMEDAARARVAANPAATGVLLIGLIEQGHIPEAWQVLDAAPLNDGTRGFAYLLHLYVSPLVDAEAEARFSLGACGTEPSADCLLQAGTFAADRGRVQEAEERAAALESLGRKLLAEDSGSWPGRRALVMAKALRGYVHLRAGRAAEAARVLDEVRRDPGPALTQVNLWLADALVQAGDHAGAVPVLRSLLAPGTTWYATLRLAEVSAARGDHAAAREHAARFLEGWAAAEADLEPVARARAVLEQAGTE